MFWTSEYFIFFLSTRPAKLRGKNKICLKISTLRKSWNATSPREPMIVPVERWATGHGGASDVFNKRSPYGRLGTTFSNFPHPKMCTDHLGLRGLKSESKYLASQRFLACRVGIPTTARFNNCAVARSCGFSRCVHTGRCDHIEYDLVNSVLHPYNA